VVGASARLEGRTAEILGFADFAESVKEGAVAAVYSVKDGSGGDRTSEGRSLSTLELGVRLAHTIVVTWVWLRRALMSRRAPRTSGTSWSK